MIYLRGGLKSRRGNPGGGETENGRGRSPAVFEGRRFRAPLFYAYWYCFLYFRRKRIVMIVASSSENTTEYHTP